jgi:hypothetical protein
MKAMTRDEYDSADVRIEQKRRKEMTREEETSPIKETARVAGFLYLLLAVFGAFGLK